MSALIIANGSFPQDAIVRSLLKKTNKIICSDGGANFARKKNILPDIILGDFDSITETTKRYFKNVPQLIIEDQYCTDLEKAIIYCVKNDIPEAFVIGATGNRLDHTTGSLGCFKKFHGDIILHFVDETGTLSFAGKKLNVVMEPGEKLSLIPLGRCSGISTKNLLYPLHNDTLEIGVQEGISNKATGKNVTVSVRKGILLYYRFHSKKASS